MGKPVRWSEGDVRIGFEPLVPFEWDGLPMGAEVPLKSVRGGDDVARLACGSGSLSDPERGLRIG